MRTLPRYSPELDLKPPPSPPMSVTRQAFSICSCQDCATSALQREMSVNETTTDACFREAVTHSLP